MKPGLNRIVVTSAKGLVPYVSKELVSLNFGVVSQTDTSVETSGTITDAMKLNIYLRTGQRVLYFLREFSAQQGDDLYKAVKKIKWEDYLHEDGYFSVTSSVDTPSIRDSRYANVRCKDGIVDRFRELRGKRPDSGRRRDKAVIFLLWRDAHCSIFLDTSGEPLTKRNYRKERVAAPMLETLASGLIMASEWNGKGNFVNPMCGSGTLAIEAALISMGKPPALSRTNFGFMHLKGFRPDRWDRIHRSATNSARKDVPCKIIATDISKKAVSAARRNAANARVDHVIEFKVCDFPETPIPAGGGVVMLNPEYGERMGSTRQLQKTYAMIGDFFKQKCLGYHGYVFTGNMDLAKKIGLRTKRRLQFYNGNIECRLLEYEIYEGSKKRERYRDRF